MCRPVGEAACVTVCAASARLLLANEDALELHLTVDVGLDELVGIIDTAQCDEVVLLALVIACDGLERLCLPPRALREGVAGDPADRGESERRASSAFSGWAQARVRVCVLACTRAARAALCARGASAASGVRTGRCLGPPRRAETSRGVLQ